MTKANNQLKLVTNRSKIMKEMYSTPERREQFRKLYEERRESHTKTIQEMYNTPERREQFRQQYEDHRESHTKRMKELWQTPEYVYKVMKSRFNKEYALKSLEKRFGWDVRQEFEHKNSIISSDDTGVDI